MRIRVKKGGSASESDVAKLQRKVGVSLPIDFLQFVARNDGAEPETNIFQVGSNESGINGFIPVREIPREIENIENLPPHSFPLAWAEGGNYLLLCFSGSWEVYFWDHEQPENFVRLGPGLARFLELIEPLDVTSIKLKPGQVKKAWIDPDFLKDLKVE
jgi:hypothetical protein